MRMKKLKSRFLYRVLAWNVIWPFLLLGFRVGEKVHGHRRLRSGKLSVWGDADFLNVCSSSIDRLQSLDCDLHLVLTQRRWVWVLQASKGTPYMGCLGPPWLFNVDPLYMSWHSDGIIARLVYVAFCISEFSTHHTSKEEMQERHLIVMKSSGSWLEMRGFPQGLVDCYA